MLFRPHLEYLEDNPFYLSTKIKNEYNYIMYNSCLECKTIKTLEIYVDKHYVDHLSDKSVLTTCTNK